MEGISFRSIERLLKVNHQSVANWVKTYSERLPKAKVPEKPKVAELDKLLTFVGRKKNEYYILRIVDRETRCVLSRDVVKEQTSDAMQACLDHVQQDQRCFSCVRYLVLWRAQRKAKR